MTQAETTNITRRTAVKGLATAPLSGALIAVPAWGEDHRDMERLFEAWQAAHAEHNAAIERASALFGKRGQRKAEKAASAACYADGDALLAVCEYPCRTMEGVRTKAAFLLRTPPFVDREPWPDLVDALVRSLAEGRA